jgi:hypothetical protein
LLLCGQEPHAERQGLAKRLAQRKFLTTGLVPLGSSQARKQQRIWLRNTKISGSCARESRESTYECRPSSYHCLPRRSRWPRAYAGYAIGKGLITTALTVWLAIEQQFSGRSAKTALPQGRKNNRNKKKGEAGAPVPKLQTRKTCFFPMREAQGYPQVEGK